MSEAKLKDASTAGAATQSDTASAAKRAAMYQETSKQFLDRFNATRQIEWIVNGALWGGIILAGARLAGHVTVMWGFWKILFAGLGAGSIHFLLWMYPIQQSENIDSTLARQYRLSAHGAARGNDPLGQPDWEAKLEDIAKMVPDGHDSDLYGLGDFAWPLIECGTTAVLVWSTLWFLRTVPWHGGA